MGQLDKDFYFWIVIIALVWSLPWKGVALWKAAKENHKKWFIALLVFNTLAILEILYIFVFSKKKQPSDSAVSSDSQFEDL